MLTHTWGYDNRTYSTMIPYNSYPNIGFVSGYNRLLLNMPTLLLRPIIYGYKYIPT